jgi:YD repeat-containing protein
MGPSRACRVCRAPLAAGQAACTRCRTPVEYDTAHRITRAVDDRGRAVAYTYDAGGRLVGVTDGAQRAVRLRYDGTTLLGAADDHDRSLFAVRYAGDRVAEVRLRDGRAYRFQFEFAADRPNDAVQAVVTAPDGTATRLAPPRPLPVAP